MTPSRIAREVRRAPWQSLLAALSVALATALAGVGAAFATQLASSNGELFAAADVPHLVQMHAGEVDAAAIDEFAAAAPEVTRSAVVELVSIDSSRLSFAPGTTEAASVVEYSATVAAAQADRLIGLDGRPAAVPPGGIGIPVDIALDRGMAVGDTVRIGERGFTVSAIVRDAMMGSDLASSRRLLVHDDDLPGLRAESPGTEHLVEFWLTDAGLAPRVYDAYLAAGLPASGPMVDFATFQVLNGLSDGLVSAAMLVVAGLLAAVAALLLSITVRTSIAAMLPQVGVLRAIGIDRRRLRGLVLGRHLALVVAGALLGGLIAAMVAPLATETMRMRLGGAFAASNLVAIAAVALVAVGAGLLLMRLVLRPALRSSPLDAMRGTGDGRERDRARGRRRRRSDVRGPAWWLLGRRQLLRAPADHLTLLAIAAAATLLAAVPMGLRATIAAPDFTTATGIAVSDLLISFRDEPGTAERVGTVAATLRQDADIERTTTLRTERLPAQEADGAWTGINIESGDHTAFPLDYRSGRAPGAVDEIALSELNAASFEVGVGDRLRVRIGDEEHELAVVGVYRDATNSGRTAKGVLPEGVGTPLWTSILADVRPGADTAAAVERYAELAAPARVVDIDAARASIIGPIERAVTNLAAGAAAAAIILVALLSALILRLFLVRDERPRAVAQAIGTPLEQRRAQYLLRLVAPVGAGVLLGSLAAPALGSGLLVAAGRMMGASGLPLRADLVGTLVVLPALLLLATTLAVLLGVRRIHPSRAARLVAGQDV